MPDALLNLPDATLDVLALLDELTHTFTPIARLRGVVLKHNRSNAPLVVTTSLEGVLPAFTTFLIKMAYFLKNGMTVELEAHFFRGADNQNTLRLQVKIPKFDINPNLFVTGEQKILRLDNSLRDQNMVFVDVLLDEPMPIPTPLQLMPDTLASRHLAQQFGNRAKQFAQDRLTVDKIRSTATVRDAQFLAVIEQTLASHLDNSQLDADLLGRAVGVSKAQLFRRLKQLTGFSAANYIRHVRLHRAGDLLQTTSLTVSEIAYRVGFQDLSYFTRSFSDTFGCAPSEWRKQQKMKQ